MQNQNIFTFIHKWSFLWFSRESKSGAGSTLAKTQKIRKELPKVIQKFNIKTLLDIPCGDFHWMKEVKLGCKYQGADIVPQIIEKNNSKYVQKNISFQVSDLLKDNLPKSDMVMIRDCFIHFSNKDIKKALRNVKKSGSAYIATTTHRKIRKNKNIPTGLWRKINLEVSPFNFPKPLATISENKVFGINQDKCLGIWKIADIPLSSLAE